MSTSQTAVIEKDNDFPANLRTRGCPVCNYVIKTARDFFAHWQYALASDEAAQESFATELGFCPRHAWQLHSMSSPWGESIGLSALTEKIAHALANTECDETASSNVHKIPRLRENCRICAMLKDAEAAYVERLATFISEEKGAQLYKRSGGLCLPHLARMFAVVSNPVRKFLLTTASRRFEQVTQQMRNYAAKREALRRDLISADEEDASLRALVHLVGAEDYCAP
ncbi:MAG: hypothetical protein DME33_04955 [Verrucomicrobia bacterium]|nr:MAG: hypothetical protein DME33_04955 [Verrucomicrobiota bacterium]